MSPRSPLTDAADASWLQLEELVERLHAAARSDATPREFYRQLLAETCAAVRATGGAGWRRVAPERLEVVAELRSESAGVLPDIASRRDAVLRAFAASSLGPTIAGDVAGFESVIAPIADAAGAGAPGHGVIGALELWFPPSDSSTVAQGRRELAATLAAIAADFHTLAELRERRATAGLQQHAIDFLRRIQQPRDLEGTAFAVANEARRLLQCDRVSLLLRRGEGWRLVCVSGVSRADRQSEMARLAARLAEDVANWGEPIVHVADRLDDADLPTRLAATLAEHLDHSHARQLAAAPFSFDDSHLRDERVAGQGGERSSNRYDLVLIAERFDGAADDAVLRQLIEIGELAAPAVARAATLDQFPVRTMLAWSDRLAALREPVRRRRALWTAGGVIAAVLALIFVPATLTVEAPATLAASVEREIFATATGSIVEVRVTHGDRVKQGDLLIVLSDPELALKLQQVRGEIAAAQERLDALAVTRTDRTLRDRETEDRLPLSAEQRQLEERLAGLQMQRQLLEERHAALTLRSPIDGEILTPDVQTLLASRPVERGEALLTVADASTGWFVNAEAAQRDVGEILAAQRAASGDNAEVTASVRLSGDVAQTYPAHLMAVSSAAPLAANGLEDAVPPMQVRLALDGEPPAEARPGMAAVVRIDCGRRSIGYVWLHDVWATAYRWLTF
ncbi:efflux RND transporter periplasmic adaptor subunit [Lacipirellula sp.]|uniref:efflux RND transporter periplasmic adaptor subunit n=1 Tax=Lacipirellula sp. TaxID=2691419 RepID=UPI003D10C9AF